MSHKFLKPAVPGQSNRDPKTGRKLPDEGAMVKMTTFWSRRLKDKSVVEAEPPSQESLPTPTPEPTEED